jgi:hypothetical protein
LSFRSTILGLAASLLLAAGLTVPSLAADVTRDGDVVKITGEIEIGDFDKFATILFSAEDKPTTVLLKDSPGGAFGDSISIGAIIRRFQLDTDVEGYCNSGCAYIWLAGDTRYYDPFSSIGFHMPGNPEVDDTEEELEATRKQAEPVVSWYLGFVGMDLNGVTVLLTVRYDTIRFFTAAELAEWGIETVMKPRREE